MKSDFIQKIKQATAFAPIACAAGAQVGISVDRTGFNSVLVSQLAGLVLGAPSPYTWTIAKIVTGSAGGLTAASTLLCAISNPTLSTTVAANVFDQIDLRGADKYIAICFTITLTGGSTPTVPVAVEFILGDAVIEPTLDPATNTVLP